MIGIRLLILIIFCCSIGFSQTDSLTLSQMNFQDLRKLGNSAFYQNDHNSAVDYYSAYLKTHPADSKIQYKIAESFRKIRDYENAEKFYLKAYESNKIKNSIALYYYADMCKTSAKYEKAKENYSKFTKEYKGSESDLKKQAKKEILFCDSVKNLINQAQKVIVHHLDTSINKQHVELSPILLDENTLLYSSLRTNKKEYVMLDEGENTDPSNIPVLKFYTAKKANNEWVYNSEFKDGPFNKSGQNVGNATFTHDKKRMYYTVCKPNMKGDMICAIYMTERTKNKWKEPIKLNDAINNPNYTSSQPAVATDPVKGNDIVYFVSNRPKGKGGLDIWYFIYEKKKKVYKEPKNAGGIINSSKDELTPFFDNDTRTLYFSSEGLGGLGGLDIYKSITDNKKWTAPENLGEPINSGADDIYYSISHNRSEGFFVSNRKGGVSLKSATCCDDIYEYKFMEYVHLFAEGNVSELLHDTPKGIDSALVDIYLVDNKNGDPVLIKTVATDKLGNYKTSLEPGKEYKIVVKKTGYINSTEATVINTKDQIKDKKFDSKFVISKITHNKAITLENIIYEFDRSDLSKSTTEALDTTLYKILVFNPDIIVEVSSHTDDKGTDDYNLKLSQKRAESVVNYMISKGIDKSRIKAIGYGESSPIAPNKNENGSDNPEGRAKNRRTDFKIIGTITNYGDDD